VTSNSSKKPTNSNIKFVAIKIVIILGAIGIGWFFLEMQSSKARKLEAEKSLAAKQAIENEKSESSHLSVEKETSTRSNVDRLDQYLSALEVTNEAKESEAVVPSPSVVDLEKTVEKEVDSRYALMRKTNLRGTRIAHPEYPETQVVSPVAYIFVCLNESSREEEFFQVSEKDFKRYQNRDLFSVSSAKDWKQFEEMPTSESLASEWVKTADFENTGAASGKGSAVLAVKEQIEKIKARKKKSISSGVLRDGALKYPAKLKNKGPGYLRTHPNRDTNYGSDRMVFGLMWLGAEMSEKLGPSDINRFTVSDIGYKSGGPTKGHVNHQMGHDVDIHFYITSLKGEPLHSAIGYHGPYKFDKEGISIKKFNIDGKTRKIRFDPERNWVLICGMIENEYFGNIRAIYIADWLKKIVLDHARAKLESLPSAERRRQRYLIEEADRLISEPSSSPHENHYHLSLEK